MNNQINNSVDSNTDDVYLNLVNSYLTMSRDILNGYMTFENGLIRTINNRIIFRSLNFTMPTVPTATVPTATVPTATATAATTATVPTATVPTATTATVPSATTATATATTATATSGITFETPILSRRATPQMPDAPIRIRPQNYNSESAPSIQIPTPVRLTSRLQSLTEPRNPLPQRQGHVSLFQEQQQQQQRENNSDEHHAPTSTPPFASTFVRYRLPIPLGPRRVSGATNQSPSSPSPPPPLPPSHFQRSNSHSMSSSSPRPRIHLETPDSSPPPPPPPRLQSLSPILHTRSGSVSTSGPGPASSAASILNGFNLLNFIDTPQFNDSLVYYTQIIDRELNARSRQHESRYQNLNYDVIQQQTKIIPYCTITNPLNDVCPISQVQFDIIDCVMQINICKHNFNPYSLLRWLDSNSTCPMCRQTIDIGGHEDESVNENINTIYNNIINEEPYRSQSNNENNYDDSDYSSVG